ncbi:MAG: RNA-directed DNA polymerase [Bacteroidota bacterium]
MELIDLLAKGYFPKELPPPFNTQSLASKYNIIKASLFGAIDKTPTRCVNFSYAKIGMVRKSIKIPNPMHQIGLCEEISNNWSQIEAIYKSSTISFSRPKLKGDRAANLSQFRDFSRRTFLASYPYTFELKTDIAKYFPSIYTHSIPWAIHGKSVSKASKYDKSLLGNKLDACIQQTMYGQTIGLPIGPDTSLIVSELIGCAIDAQLSKVIPGIKGYRYVDDMYFFFNSYVEAENGFLEIQKALKEFELQVNAEKTVIRKIPRGTDNEWVIKLRSFRFRKTEGKQYNDIISFFDMAFGLSNQLPNEYILSYAVSRIKNVQPISDENWLLLETMLLKTMVAEPATIKEVFRIFYSHQSKISVKKIEKVLFNFLEYHCQRGCDFEVSWGLWMAKTFNICIPAKTSLVLSNFADTISILIILDMMSVGLIQKGDLDIAKWEEKLDKQSLLDENWLFAYEIAAKKWIGSSYDYINEVPFFKILKKSKISFYNSELQIEPIQLTKLAKAETTIPERAQGNPLSDYQDFKAIEQAEIVYDMGEDEVDIDFFDDYPLDDDYYDEFY